MSECEIVRFVAHARKTHVEPNAARQGHPFNFHVYEYCAVPWLV